MHKYYVVKFSLDGESHNIRPDMIASDKVKFKIFSSPVYVTVDLGTTALVDLDNDGVDDMSITVSSISGSTADVTLEIIDKTDQAAEEVPVEQEQEEELPERETETVDGREISSEEKEMIVDMEEQEGSGWLAYTISILTVAAIAAAAFFIRKKQPPTQISGQS